MHAYVKLQTKTATMMIKDGTKGQEWVKPSILPKPRRKTN